MRTKILAESGAFAWTRRAAMLAMTFTLILPVIACHKSAIEQTPDVAVNAPASGVVRRVLVNEGATVDQDAAILEITVQSEETKPAPTAETNRNQALAAREAKTNLAAAEADAKRTSAELQRIEPLVKQGLASKVELDKARAAALDSKDRLALAREKQQNAEANQKQTAPAVQKEEVVTVRVPAAGMIRAVTVQIGQQVVAGQPVATIASRT